ncbi:MAG: hypothetical protein PWQ67_836 [Clostridia bacterium]|nr:hypothetical protein [Clostridia bacterium]
MIVDNREEKRAKFQAEYIEAQKRKKRLILTSVFILTIFSVGLFIWINSGRYENPNSGNYFFEEVPNYTGRQVKMKDIELTLEDGKVKIPLSAIKANQIIYTEYKGKTDKIYYGNLNVLPLTAFISSAGRLIVATSICEPCYGTRFTLENKELVCQTCFTRWRNTDLFGLSGGCVKYPPEELKYQIEDGNVVISEEMLSQWQPRIFTDEMQDA